MLKIKEYNIHNLDLSKNRSRYKTTCPNCSEDRKKSNEKCLTIDKPGEWFKCNHCGWKGKLHSYERMDKIEYKKPKPHLKKPSSKIVRWFEEKRKISKATLDKLKITEGEEYMPQVGKERNVICYNYYLNNELINIKYRDGEKNFKMVSGAMLIPYNMDSIIDQDEVVMVEGENDVAAYIESGVENVISVPNGAVKEGKTDLTFLSNVIEYLQGKKFILSFDDDEAGRKLTEDVAAFLGKNNCYTVNHRGKKDANELLIEYGNLILPTVVAEKEPFPVSGIITLSQMEKRMDDLYVNGIKTGESTGIDWIDPHFRWVRGWIYLFSGYPAHGKSTFLAWLLVNKAKSDSWRFAIFSPEEANAARFYMKLIEAYARESTVPEHHNYMSRDVYEEAKVFINHHFFYIYPDDDHSIDKIDEKFEHLIKTENIDGTLVDPFNQLDRPDRNTRSDLYISEYCRRRKRFATKYNTVDITVEHPRTPKDPEIARQHPNMFNIHEGLTWGKKMDVIATIHRPKKHEDFTDTGVDILFDKIKDHDVGGEPALIQMKHLRAKKTYVPA